MTDIAYIGSGAATPKVGPPSSFTVVQVEPAVPARDGTSTPISIRSSFTISVDVGAVGPWLSDPNADLRTNTTAHLVADIEKLRAHLGIEHWTLLGVSWGSTLALAYAQAHRDRVAAVVLALVTTTSRREVEWLTRDVGRIFPREWQRFAAAVPEALRNLPLVDAYAAMLFDADPAVRAHAAREWCLWEDAHVSLAPDHRPNPLFEDSSFRLLFARLVTHYWRHAAFLDEDQLLRNAPSLNGIPGVLIHGRFDVSSPLETAWQLTQRWKTSELHVLEDAGHGNGDSFPRSVVGAEPAGCDASQSF